MEAEIGSGSGVPELPPLTKEADIENLLKRSKKSSFKKNDFFILYCSTGIDGRPLVDGWFAEQLKHALNEEELMSGRQVRALSASEKYESVQEVLLEMSKSLVILIVFSEAALRTFADEAHQYRQNNYLLYLQFALRLHDACGARVLGLNTVAVEEEDGARSYIKFQGWCVRFKDVPHYSTWIQDSISKSMKRIFSLQGINIDVEDWEFRIPTLFSSLYSMQDEINATQWTSTWKIVPWNSIYQYLIAFAICFLIPLGGLCLVCCTNCCCCAKKSSRYKSGSYNASLLGTGISLLLTSVYFSSNVVSGRTQQMMCTSPVSCEIYVQSGSFWTYWHGYASNCSCYNNTQNYGQWAPDFSPQCATCVCALAFNNTGTITIGTDDTTISCYFDTSIYLAVYVILATLFGMGFIFIFVSIASLNKTALTGKREVKIGRVGIVKEQASLNLRQGDAFDNGDVSLLTGITTKR